MMLATIFVPLGAALLLSLLGGRLARALAGAAATKVPR